jgi:hypothetical protein
MGRQTLISVDSAQALMGDDGARQRSREAA